MFIVQITLNFDKNRTSFFNWTHFIGFQLFFPADCSLAKESKPFSMGRTAYSWRKLSDEENFGQ